MIQDRATVSEPDELAKDQAQIMSDAASKRVALVTGAAQGIGQGIARVLGESGYIVVLGDVDEDLVLQAADQLRAQGFDATGMRLDVTRAGDWARAMATVRADLGRPRPAGQQRGDQPARNDRDRPTKRSGT